MGGNVSKSVSTVSVQSAIKATLNVTSSRGAVSANNQSMSFSGNEGTTLDGVNMKQKIRITIKSTSTTNASTEFASVVESNLKEKIKQATELGGLPKNKVETLQATAHSFAVDCSKVFSDNISLLISADQTLAVDNNKNSSISNVVLSQTVEGAIEAFSSIITNDKSVQKTKAILDKELEQKSEGFGGMFKSMIGPMIVILLIMIVGGYIYFRARQ